MGHSIFMPFSRIIKDPLYDVIGSDYESSSSPEESLDLDYDSDIVGQFLLNLETADGKFWTYMCTYKLTVCWCILYALNILTLSAQLLYLIMQCSVVYDVRSPLYSVQY